MSLLFGAIMPLWAQNNNDFIEFPLEDGTTKRVPTVKPQYLSLTQQDSVFLSINSGALSLTHRVKSGESLYAISRFYAMSLSDLLYNNPALENKSLRVNDLVNIPITGRAIIRHESRAIPDTSFVKVYYKVQSSETLYRIAKVYFKMPVELLQARNNLTSTGLRKGQVLHIGWMNKKGVPDNLRGATGLTGILAEESAKYQRRYVYWRSSQEEYKHEGLACWPKGYDFKDQSSLVVMHDFAEIGSIIRLENPMTGRVLYAKVIGRVPQTSFAQNAIVMLSPTVAHALGALDTHFFVRIHYLK